MNRAANVLIRAAAADVPSHRLIDIGIGRLRIFRQQRRSLHHLSRLAISTLRNIQFDPGGLHRMAAVGRETLDRGHALVFHTRDLSLARPHRVAVEKHRARAAQARAAAEFGARHPQHIPQYP